MDGVNYKNGDMCSGSFSYKSHQNLAVNATATISDELNSTAIIIALTVGAHVAINELATTASMVFPAGIWTLRVDQVSTISVLKLTGSEDGQASIIIPG